MIRLGTSADLAATTDVYRHASLSNTGDRDNLLVHPDYLILGPEGLAEGGTYVAEEDGSLVGFATWAETAGTIERHRTSRSRPTTTRRARNGPASNRYQTCSYVAGSIVHTW
jgi:hypothetical protein